MAELLQDFAEEVFQPIPDPWLLVLAGEGLPGRVLQAQCAIPPLPTGGSR